MQVLFFTFSSWPRARHVLTWNKKCAHGLALQLSGKPWSNMPSIYVNVNFYKFYYTFPGGSKNNPGNKKNSWCVFVSVHVLPSIFGTLLFTTTSVASSFFFSLLFVYTIKAFIKRFTALGYGKQRKARFFFFQWLPARVELSCFELIYLLFPRKTWDELDERFVDQAMLFILQCTELHFMFLSLGYVGSSRKRPNWAIFTSWYGN